MSKSYIKWLKQTTAEMQEHAELFPGDIDADHGKVLKALRIALASLEANSRKLFTCSACSAEGMDEPLESKCHCCIDGAHWVESRVYAAPPAPTVPDECPAEIRDLMASHSDALFNDDDAQQIWNACCSVMLQEAK